jgi:hypothetical protein
MGTLLPGSACLETSITGQVLPLHFLHSPLDKTHLLSKSWMYQYISFQL